jgi:hypothetical protein
LTQINWDKFRNQCPLGCRSLPLELFHPESAQGREEPFIFEFLTAALEKSLLKIGRQFQSLNIYTP